VHERRRQLRSRPARDTDTYTGANPFEPTLGDVFVPNSRGHVVPWPTFGCEALLTALPARSELRLSRTRRRLDERDPFTDRSFNFYDWPGLRAVAPRYPHKVNIFTYVELPRQFLVNVPCRGGRHSRSHVAARAERRRSRTELDRRTNKRSSRSTGACSVRSGSAAAQVIRASRFNTFTTRTT